MAVFRIVVKDLETGVTEFEGNYSAADTDSGRLVQNDDAVFVSPHNVMLNKYDGEWRLNEFTSTTPLLSLDQSGLSEYKAIGHIGVNSDAPSTLTTSQGLIQVVSITTPTDSSLQIRVSIDGIFTNAVDIPGTASASTVAQLIAGAINDTPAFSGVYTASVSPLTPNFVNVLAVTPGSAPNGDVIAISQDKLVAPPDAFGFSEDTTDGGDIVVTPGDYAEASIVVGSNTLGFTETLNLSVSIGADTSGWFGPVGWGQTEAQIATLVAEIINYDPILNANWEAASSGRVVNITAKAVGTAFNSRLVTVNKLGTTTGTITFGSDTTSGGADSGIVNTYSTGTLVVTTPNPDPAYNSVLVKLKVGGAETPSFTIDPSDTADNIAAAIRAGAVGQLGTWDVLGSGPNVILTQTVPGGGTNGQLITMEFIETTYIPVGSSLVTNITNMSGGADEGASLGTITVRFGSSLVLATTASIVGAETAGSIASKIKTAIDGSVYALQYGTTILGNRVNITSVASGAEFNKPITTTAPTGLTLDVSGMSGGQNVFTSGALEGNTVYWYKVRYVYRDGHKTKTCYPEIIKTGAGNFEVKLLIDLATDIDGTYADIEIFRKRGTEDFFLIDRLTPTTFEDGKALYVDAGRPELSLLDEQEYVWTQEHSAHDIVQDRYVRANVTYNDRDLGDLDETATADAVFTLEKETGESSIDNALPFNTSLDVFVRGKYDDGSDSFFKKVAGFETDFNAEHFEVSQTRTVAGIKEFGFYAKYASKAQTGFSFSGVDFASLNLPTTFSGKYENGTGDRIRSDVFPANPRMAVGFSKLKRTFNGGANRYEYYVSAADLYEFNNDETSSDTTYNKELTDARESTSDVTANHPPYIFINQFGDDVFTGEGAELLYVRTDGTSSTTTVTYEMVLAKALPLTVYNSGLFVSFQSIRPAFFVSTVMTNAERNLIGKKIKVIDYEIRKHPEATDSAGGMVYLVMEPDEDLIRLQSERYNIAGVINGHAYSALSAVATYGSGADTVIFPKPFFGTLYGLELVQDSLNLDVYAVNDVTSEALFYLGQKPNEVDSAPVELPVTGFTYETATEEIIPIGGDIRYNFRKLNDYNIFENLLTVDDLQELRRAYPNQIVWSEPIIIGSSANGYRTFKFTNFLNITTEFGTIVDIRYFGTKLFVFTERGVAIVNVGEVLAAAASGETFVDSSRFLNSSYFILRNLPAMKQKSIVRYENMLFFSDGKDVWMITDGPKNISNGAIVLAAGEIVGAIDPENKEYRISDGTQTWAFGWETGSWYGPYTYTDRVSVAVGEEMYSVVGSSIVKHNETNTFGGEVYQTIAESIAQDLDEPSIDKLYRKFYLDAEADTSDTALVTEVTEDEITDEGGDELTVEAVTTTFSYGKTYGSWTQGDFTDFRAKNGLYHVGINKTNHNAKRIFWRFVSDAIDFTVRLVSFDWMPRNRR